MIGVDVGRHYTKAVCGEKRIKFPSYVGSPVKRNLGDGGLEINIDGEHYFLGELAINESMDVTLEVTKNGLDHAKPLLINAVSQFCENTIDLVGGLQISDYRSLRDTFKNQFERTFNVNGRNISIRNATAFPQGAGALYSVLLSDEGKLVREDLAKKTIAVIDIGYRDCNICVLSNLRYIDKQSKSFPIGIHQAHLAALPELSDILPQEIPQYIERHGHGFMWPYYDQIATKIIKTINYFWPPGFADKIFLAGGGGILLDEHMMAEFGTELVPEPQFANAIGFHRVGKMLW